MNKADPVIAAEPTPVKQGPVGTLLAWASRKWRDTQHRAPVLFAASSMGLSVTQLLAGVAAVHYIDPHDMGIWASANLALTYAVLLLAGVQNGLSRELPYYLGAGDDGMARRLASTTLFYTAGGCVATVLGSMGTAVFLASQHADRKVMWALAGVTVLILCNFYQNYLFVTFRSKNSFGHLAQVQTWYAALVVATLPIFLFGYGGLLLRAAALGAVATYLMHRARPMRVSPSWRTDSFLLLVKTGIPIFATDYITNAAKTLDRVALLKFGGVEEVGLYALAVSAFSAFQVVPQSVAHYVYPRMSHHYGRTNDPRLLWTMAWKTNLIVLGAMLPIALAGYWILPFAVKLLFPKYIAGTHAAQISLFSAVAYGGSMGSNALASLKSWGHLITYQLSFAGLLAVAPFMGIRLLSSPLTGAAYGVLAANLLGAVIALVITFSATHRRPASTPSQAEPTAA
jgi:O-antigen/teichoic acid export membrane protein